MCFNVTGVNTLRTEETNYRSGNIFFKGWHIMLNNQCFPHVQFTWADHPRILTAARVYLKFYSSILQMKTTSSVID